MAHLADELDEYFEPSAAKPQPNNKDNIHHEGTKLTKEDLSRKGAKHALSEAEGDAKEN